MKTIILIILSVFLFQPLFSQTSDFYNQLTEKYADKDGFSATLLTSDMFDLYIRKKNIDEKSAVFETLKKLNYIMVVSQSNFTGLPVQNNLATGQKDVKNELFQSMLDHYKKGGYTLFKTEKRMGEDIKVFLKKNQAKITSLALINSSSFSTNLVELEGDIDMNTVSKLGEALNMKGIENLGRLENNAVYGFYPGVNISQEQVDDMVAKQMELVAKQKGLSEKQIAEFEKQAQINAEKQLQLAEKHREMAERYGREPIFLSTPGDTNVVYYIDGKKVSAKEVKELDVNKIASMEVNKSPKKGEKATIHIKTK